MRQLFNLHIPEPCFIQELGGFFPTPHGTESVTTLSQRHRHAMGCRQCIEQWSHRVFHVFVDVTRGMDVLHQIHAVLFQCLVYALQNIEWLGLVMDRIKRCNEVKLFGTVVLVEIGDVLRYESGVS